MKAIIDRNSIKKGEIVAIIQDSHDILPGKCHIFLTV